MNCAVALPGPCVCVWLIVRLEPPAPRVHAEATRAPHSLLTAPPRPSAQGRGSRKLINFEVGTPLKDVERRLIEETLRMTHGDKSLAASLLGITARTIYRREAEWKEELDS